MRLPLPISGAIATAAVAGSLVAASALPDPVSTPICGDPLPPESTSESAFVVVPTEAVEFAPQSGVSINTHAGSTHLRFHPDGVSMYVGQPADALLTAWNLPNDARQSALIRHEGLTVHITDGRVATIELDSHADHPLTINGTEIVSLAQLPDDEALGACLDTMHHDDIAATCPHLGLTVFMDVEDHSIGVFMETVE